VAALGIGAFIVALILVIVIHEAAHFAVARAFGIKVTEFFVGFGPKLWSRMRGETEVGVKAIVAGGYVKIAGMNPYETIAPEDYPRTFGAKPIWQRAVAGVRRAANAHEPACGARPSVTRRCPRAGLRRRAAGW
jgi:RIP metalloprotease RseP